MLTWGGVEASKADLDKRYPGWLERWAVAYTLELRRDELRRYVFPAVLLLNLTQAVLPCADFNQSTMGVD